MGRRSEPRIAVSLPVVVRGIDSHGNPFAIKTETQDIGFSGASLRGLAEIVAPGMKIELDSSGRKAWYRVEWTTARTSKEQCTGIRSLEYGKYIWGVAPKGWEPDMFEPDRAAGRSQASVEAAFRSSNDPDRREFARHACRIEAVLTAEDESVTLPGKITDISLNGCYVEMLSPLPAESPIRVSFEVNGEAVEVAGKATSSQIGTGMAVVFTAMNPATFEKLRSFAPPVTPPVESTAKPARSIYTQRGPVGIPDATVTEAVDAVVRLLLLKGLITPEELSEEIGRTRARRATVSV